MLSAQLSAGRRELARLIFSPPHTTEPGEVQERRTTLQSNLAALEEELASSSAAFATARQIASALPQGAVLLDYVRFRDFTISVDKKDRLLGDWRYVVFVTPAGEAPKPVMVNLGLAKPVDEAIAAVLESIGKVEAGQRPKDDEAIRKRLMALRKLVVDPALPHIRDKDHWIVCPDGRISLVPFECLPSTHGRYLIESHKVSYLGAGREMVAYAGARAKPEGVAKPLLVGESPLMQTNRRCLSRVTRWCMTSYGVLPPHC